MSEPREFWILFKPNGNPEAPISYMVNSLEHPGKYADQHIHVIEYSAFEQLRAERDELEKKYDMASGNEFIGKLACEAVVKERDQLRSQLAVCREALELLIKRIVIMQTEIEMCRKKNPQVIMSPSTVFADIDLSKAREALKLTDEEK